MPTEPPPTLPTVQRLIAAARTTERNALRQRLRDPALVDRGAQAIQSKDDESWPWTWDDCPLYMQDNFRDQFIAALAVIEEALQ